MVNECDKTSKIQPSMASNVAIVVETMFTKKGQITKNIKLSWKGKPKCIGNQLLDW
jgi:hypothetical protein